MPLPLPVKVRQSLPPDHDEFDLTWKIRKSSRRFLIEITQGLPLWALEEVLIHSWAHCMCWVPDSPFRTDHDEFWGVAYSKAYRAYHGVV